MPLTSRSRRECASALQLLVSLCAMLTALALALPVSSAQTSSQCGGSVQRVFLNVSSYEILGLAVGTDGTVLFADLETNPMYPHFGGRVVLLSPNGTLLAAYPNASNPLASNYTFNVASSVALDGAGRIYAADEVGGSGGDGAQPRVVVLSPTGSLIATFPDNSSAATGGYNFSGVVDVAVDVQGRIYVVDAGNGGAPAGDEGRVVVLSPNGTLLYTFPDVSRPITAGYTFTSIIGLAIDRVSGNVVVNEEYEDPTTGSNGRVVVLSSQVQLLHTFPNASSPSTSGYVFDDAYGVAVDGQRNIYVGDSSTITGTGVGRVVVLSPNGTLLYTFPSNTSCNATSSYGFFHVFDVDVDSAGNIYVSTGSTPVGDGPAFAQIVVLNPISNGACCAAPASSSTARPFSSSVASSSVVSSSAHSSSVSSSAVSSSVVSSSAVSSSTVSSSAMSSSTVSSSAMSSSTVSSSALSSSAVSSSSSSSTGVASVYSDPRFVGFWGQSFYVSGVVGGVYSLLSDACVQVNGYVVQLQSVSCPVLDGRKIERCFDEQGTYFAVLAVQVQGGTYVRLTGGAAQDGFHSVSVNDQRSLAVGERYEAKSRRHGVTGVVQVHTTNTTTTTTTTINNTNTTTNNTNDSTTNNTNTTSTTLSVHRTSTHRVLITAGLYSLTIDSVDQYVDLTQLDVSSWDELLSARHQPDGLLGRTWNDQLDTTSSDAEVERYRTQRDDILACATHTQHDRFCTAGRRGEPQTDAAAA